MKLKFLHVSYITYIFVSSECTGIHVMAKNLTYKKVSKPFITTLHFARQPSYLFTHRTCLVIAMFVGSFYSGICPSKSAYTFPFYWLFINPGNRNSINRSTCWNEFWMGRQNKTLPCKNCGVKLTPLMLSRNKHRTENQN